MEGLIHLYCGDGKGKTTSATGLVIRALGAGKKVIYSQFLKDGTSSELKMLGELKNIRIYCSEKCCGFYVFADEDKRKVIRTECKNLFENIISDINSAELLVFDEIISACNYGIIDENILVEFLKNKPCSLEVVLTGRNPSDNLLKLADYVTEMKKVKHPYDKGIEARIGVEY